ncbi:hypothetical protein LR48_Vigan01g119500 [Vigna angularis]|uniref:Uncharacterized protein n=1 Tax=Phaseolus angularis TaxID=3914 RepID=A0A0L9TM57_PHAAN|nr:hypothetical protein LR48_Vigan01g119500 [Vigna angularis]
MVTTMEQTEHQCDNNRGRGNGGRCNNRKKWSNKENEAKKQTECARTAPGRRPTFATKKKMNSGVKTFYLS